MNLLKKIQHINVIGVSISLILFLSGILFENPNMLLIAIVAVVGVIVCNSVSNLRNGIVLLLYMVSFVTFMISRPLLNLFLNQSENSIFFKPLSLVYTAVLCIYFGSQLCKTKSIISISDSKDNVKKLAAVSLISKIIFYLTTVFAWIVTFEKIVLVINLGYIGLYTDYNSVLPSIVHKLAVANEISFYVYIMTFPNKKSTYISFGVYSVGLILKLMTGVRGEFLIGIMLLITYTIFRNRSTNKPIFSSKGVKCIIVALAILLISYLGVFASIRQGEEGGSFIQGFEQFFSQQGGTISLLKNAITHKSQLKSMNNNYTFSSITNYNSVTRWVGKVLLGFNTDGSKLHSGYLGNNLTYIIEPTYYNIGGSFGTAYLAELFIDYSYIGIVIYNLMLGFILKKATTVKLSNWAVGAYYLYIIRSLYFLPRDSAFSFVTPILSMSNLIVVLGIKVLSDAIVKKKGKIGYENTLVGKYNN